MSIVLNSKGRLVFKKRRIKLQKQETEIINEIPVFIKQIKKKGKKYYRIKPRTEDLGDCYVLLSDLISVHGKEWTDKFKVFIYGSTTPFINNTPAIFYYDYERFADKIDFETITYWD